MKPRTITPFIVLRALCALLLLAAIPAGAAAQEGNIVPAGEIAQEGKIVQGRKIVLYANEMTRQEVVEQIEKQTGLSVAYSRDRFDDRAFVGFPATELELKDLLDRLVANTGHNYRIDSRHILIYSEKVITHAAVATPLQTGYNVMGTVLGFDTKPLGGVTVEFPDLQNKRVATSADGTFRIANIAPGIHSVRLTSANKTMTSLRRVAVASGDANVEFITPEGFRLDDWSTLVNIMKTDRECQYSCQVISIVENGKSDAQIVGRLKELNGGQTLDYIVERHGALLRAAAGKPAVRGDSFRAAMKDAAPPPVTDTAPAVKGQPQTIDIRPDIHTTIRVKSPAEDKKALP